MRSIDIHAHISPEAYIRAVEAGENWYGIAAEADNFHRAVPRTMWSPEQRLKDMDSLGVDVHVLSTNSAFYFYEKDAAIVAAMDGNATIMYRSLPRTTPTVLPG